MLVAVAQRLLQTVGNYVWIHVLNGIIGGASTEAKRSGVGWIPQNSQLDVCLDIFVRTLHPAH